MCERQNVVRCDRVKVFVCFRRMHCASVSVAIINAWCNIFTSWWETEALMSLPWPGIEHIPLFLMTYPSALNCAIAMEDITSGSFLSFFIPIFSTETPPSDTVFSIQTPPGDTNFLISVNLNFTVRGRSRLTFPRNHLPQTPTSLTLARLEPSHDISETVIRLLESKVRHGNDVRYRFNSRIR